MYPAFMDTDHKHHELQRGFPYVACFTRIKTAWKQG